MTLKKDLKADLTGSAIDTLLPIWVFLVAYRVISYGAFTRAGFLVCRP